MRKKNEKLSILSESYPKMGQPETYILLICKRRSAEPIRNTAARFKNEARLVRSRAVDPQRPARLLLQTSQAGGGCLSALCCCYVPVVVDADRTWTSGEMLTVTVAVWQDSMCNSLSTLKGGVTWMSMRTMLEGISEVLKITFWKRAKSRRSRRGCISGIVAIMRHEKLMLRDVHLFAMCLPPPISCMERSCAIWRHKFKNRKFSWPMHIS